MLNWILNENVQFCCCCLCTRNKETSLKDLYRKNTEVHFKRAKRFFNFIFITFRSSFFEWCNFLFSHPQFFHRCNSLTFENKVSNLLYITEQHVSALACCTYIIYTYTCNYIEIVIWLENLQFSSCFVLLFYVKHSVLIGIFNK